METLIQPQSRVSSGLRELWQYRELFYFFTWRDIKVKYKQTYLGIIWALLQPLGMMGIFTFLFARTWPINTDPFPYPIFVLSGLICWNLFSSAISHAGESMIRNAHIINKIYFPRLIIPGSSVLVSLFDFIMGFIIFVVICIYYGQPVNWSALWCFPLAMFILLIASFGAGTFLSALNIRYRDFRYTIPFLLQVLFFGSQIIYPLQAIRQSWIKYVLALNPLNAVIELFRVSLWNDNTDTTTISIGIASAIIMLVTGIYYFKKTEAHFADLA